MQRMLPFLLLLASACGSKAPDTTPAGKHVIRSMQIAAGQPSHLSFESSSAEGTIEIAADVHVGYQSVTVTPASAGGSSQRITVDEKAVDFWGHELTIGEKSYGRLAGEVRIEIGRAGVSVNGEKRGDLQP